MDRLVMALGPVFAAGFAAQQLLEVMDVIVTKLGWPKKIVLGLCSVVIGLVLAFGAGLRVLEPLGVMGAGLWDTLVSGLIVSAGTEGVNSVLKFLGYMKEAKKAVARGGCPDDAKVEPAPTRRPAKLSVR